MVSKMNKNEKKLVDEFSRHQADYESWNQEKKKKMSFNNRAEDWKTPNLNLMAQMLIFHEEFSRLGNFYGRIEENNNLWIVKPASSARGNGIFVTDKFSDIIKDEKMDTVGKDTLVQKYLERPCLLQIDKFQYKFDIRQWVLVTDLSPLTIHIFTGFYCRLCSNPFDISLINDFSRHLTNYSVNKTNFKSNSGLLKSSVRDDTFLKKYMSENHNLDWESEMQPQIENIVIESIKSGADKMKPRERSFEIYGFDIIIDGDLKPYLLEINLSPACEEREQFLIKMLDDMSNGLFEVLKEKEKNHTENTRIVIEKEQAEKREKERRAQAGISDSMMSSQIHQLGAQNNLKKKQEPQDQKNVGPSVLNPKLMDLRTVQLAPTFSNLDFKFNTDLMYKWKKIYQEDVNNQVTMLRPGNENFIEIEGKSLNLRQEMNFDRRFKRS